ncbi:MAG: proteasome assembly chaperone family protein [Candidatus Hadarchaeota archaeon]
MKTTLIAQLFEAEMNDPILIEGLPGMGYVGKLAAEHLLEKFGSKKFAEIYSPHFPHHVTVENDGIIRPLKNEIFQLKVDGKDLLIWVGDVQPVDQMGHYEIVQRVLDLAWEAGVRKVITLGGFATGKYSNAEPRVIGLGDAELVKKAEEVGAVSETAGGPIIGAAGLLIGLGNLREMKGICLLGETHGMLVDHRAAKAVLQTLADILGIKVDMTNMEEKAKATERLIGKIQKEMELRETEEKRAEEPSYIG